MGSEKARETSRVATSHAAFGGDTIDTNIAPGSGKAGGIAGRVVVVDKAEIEPGLRVESETGERGKIGVVGTVLWYWQVKVVNWAPDSHADCVGHLDHQTGILGLHEMLIGGAAIAEVVAEFDAGRDALADFSQDGEGLI